MPTYRSWSWKAEALPKCLVPKWVLVKIQATRCLNDAVFSGEGTVGPLLPTKVKTLVAEDTFLATLQLQSCNFQPCCTWPMRSLSDASFCEVMNGWLVQWLFQQGCEFTNWFSADREWLHLHCGYCEKWRTYSNLMYFCSERLKMRSRRQNRGLQLLKWSLKTWKTREELWVTCGFIPLTAALD